jgi:hypothetical protein
MLEHLWSVLRDNDNRAIMGWLGGGIVVAATGAWSIFKYLRKKRAKDNKVETTVIAIKRSVAAGRDLRDTNIKS